jgi:hypothetical protein
MRAKSGPRPEVAFWLSVVVPGLGHIYAGAPLRGVLCSTLVLLGLAGVLDSDFFTSSRPWYRLYGVLGALVMLSAWWFSARHAGTLSSRRTGWPPLYRFFGRPLVRRCIEASRAELIMASVFVLFLALCALGMPSPAWFPEPPRYWFLYEVFAALYLVVFHAVVEVRLRTESLDEARAAGFFVITFLLTGSLLLFTGLPAEVILFAFLVALPSCWFSLRHRGSEETRRQVGRLFLVAFLGFAAFVAYGFVVNVWEIVSGVRQYELRLARDETVAFAVIGLFYYLLRAGCEALFHVTDTANAPADSTRSNSPERRDPTIPSSPQWQGSVRPRTRRPAGG